MPPLPLTGSALPTFLNITTKQKFRHFTLTPDGEASNFSARANYDYAIGTPDGNRGALGHQARFATPAQVIAAFQQPSPSS